MKDKNIDYTPSLFPDLYSEKSLPVVDNKQKEQWALKKKSEFRYGVLLISILLWPIWYTSN